MEQFLHGVRLVVLSLGILLLVLPHSQLKPLAQLPVLFKDQFFPLDRIRINLPLKKPLLVGSHQVVAIIVVDEGFRDVDEGLVHFLAIRQSPPKVESWLNNRISVIRFTLWHKEEFFFN